MSERTVVGYVGAGAMGLPMVKALLAAGFAVVGYDLRRDALRELEAVGAEVASSVTDLASRTRIVCVAVLSEAGVEGVCEELHAALAEGSFVLIHSTVSPQLCGRLSTLGAERGIRTVDACVSGNLADAEQGLLTLMVGATEQHVQPVRPVLDAVSKSCLFLGRPGAGAAVKLANNVMSIINTLAVYEALRLAAAYGVGAEQLIGVSRVSSGNSTALTNHAKFDWSLQHHTLAGSDQIFHLFSKDLDLAIAEGRRAGVDLAFVEMASRSIPAQFAKRMTELGLDAPDLQPRREDTEEAS